MQLKSIFTKEQGDTIVEVLIAIAVISAVLGTSYAIVNRNSKSQQQTAEHTEALKQVEKQLELVRSIAQKQTDPSFDEVFTDSSVNSFCIAGSSFKKNPNPNGSDCQFAGRYTVIVSKLPNNVYKSEANWDSLNTEGDGKDRVSLTYKVFP